MDRQQEFVLRTIEERDVVRAPVVHRRGRHAEVGGAGAGRGRGRLRGGPGLRRLGDRGPDPRLRVRHARAAGSRDLPDPAVARRDRPDVPDVLRHPDPGRRAVRRGSAQRAQAHPGQGRRHGLHLLHAPGDRVLPAEVAASSGPTARSRWTRPATSTTCPGGAAQDFRRRAVRMLEDLGISVEFSHHEAGPGQNEIDLRYADALHDGGQHHDVPHGHQGGGASSRASTPRSCPSRSPATRVPACTPTSRCSRATRTPSTRPAPSTSCPRRPASSSPACCKHAPEITAVTNQFVNSYKRLWGGGEAPSYV